MSAIVLFEDHGYRDLLPLLWWRSVFELRVGRRIVLDRTSQVLGRPVGGVWTRDWLATVAAQRCGAPANAPVQAGTVLVNGRWLVDDVVEFPDAPAVGIVDEVVVYIVCDEQLAATLKPQDLLDPLRQQEVLAGVVRVPAGSPVFRFPWELIRDFPDRLIKAWGESDAAIESDLDRVTIESPGNVHVGERCRIHPTVIIDAAPGPVFISHDVQIGAYAVIEGPAYIGPGSSIGPHAWIHGGNAFGPVCKVGGEVAGCILHGYTNKQHNGFLGHAYVGSWVNFGAGCCNSDLKNTYGTVRAPVNGKEVDTGECFFGAIIGDHAKLGINAIIPTGAVIGFAAMVASGRVPPKYIPSFGWCTDDGLKRGDTARLLDVASAVMARREIDLTDAEVELFLDLDVRVGEIESGHPKRR